jgi:hypothetical protein
MKRNTLNGRIYGSCRPGICGTTRLAAGAVRGKNESRRPFLVRQRLWRLC